MNNRKVNNELADHLNYLKLPWIRDNYAAMAQEAASQKWDHIEFLRRMAEGEANVRKDRSTERRIKDARFPVVKTLEQFDWSWPRKINRPQIQNLFRLQFIEQKANVVFLGGVGLGKSHLAVALGYQACLQGMRTLFASAADIINSLAAAQAAHRLKTEISRYLRPDLLIIDELGFLPLDKLGADMIFQVISRRYEQGATVLTSNKPFNSWPSIFNNDSTVTSAILDRLVHHSEIVMLHGKSYRMKDRIDANEQTTS